MIGNVYLTGFMGAGKTTVGRLLAQLLHRRFVDLDDRLAAKFGRPVSEIFDHQGEAAFRRAEAKALDELGRQRGLVVAVGGGAPVFPANRRVMSASGRVVFLAAPPEVCQSRLSESDKAARPLWRDGRAAAALYAKRLPAYRRADLEIAADRAAPPETAWEIARRLLGEVSFTARLEDRKSPVTATMDGPARLAEAIRGRRVFVLSDGRVAGRHLERYRETLGGAPSLILPPGERTKTIGSARAVYQKLIAERLDRGDLLVALGGGMITDLGAFVAATYKRGMGFVLVSTSLLGCVDAAVGGKTAVNLGRAKNVVGAFAAPEAVILDVAALSTLDGAGRREGLVEAYKTGLVADEPLARFIEQDAASLMAGDLAGLFRVAAESARTKARVVRDDFREHGRRAILNLGHTYGHAVEAWHDYRVSHGRAVAVGMRAALEISRRRGLLAEETAGRVVAALNRLDRRATVRPPLDEAWEIMLQDKKIRQGRMVFVLLEDYGRPVLVHDVTRAELAAALAGLGEA